MPTLTLVSEQKRLRRELKNTVVGLKEVLREIWQFFNSVTSGQSSKRSQNTAVERVRTQHKFLMHHLSMFNQQKDRFTAVCDEAFYDVEEPRFVHVMQYFDSIEEFVLDFDNRRERSCRAAVAKLVKEREAIQDMFQKLTKALNAFVLQFDLFLKQDRFKEYVQGLIVERGTSKRKRRVVYDGYDEENYDDEGDSLAATSGALDYSLSKYEDAAQERSQRMAEEAERDGVLLGNRRLRKRRFTRVDLYEYGNECRELPDNNKESDDDEDDESVEIADDDDDDDDDTISDDDEYDEDDDDDEDEKEDEKFDDKVFHKADDVLLNGESSSGSSSNNDDEESVNEEDSDDEAHSVAESDIDKVSADDLDAEIEGDDCGSTSSEQQSDPGSDDGSDAS